MAKKSPPVDPGEQVFDLALSEWCATLSTSDTRVELIGAFHQAEVAAGRGRGSAAGYAERFDSFANRPA